MYDISSLRVNKKCVTLEIVILLGSTTLQQQPNSLPFLDRMWLGAIKTYIGQNIQGLLL